MSATFKAALNALNLNHADAAALLGNKADTIADMARDKTRIPPGLWRDLAGLFEAVEQAADKIIADQAEIAGDVQTLEIAVTDIDLPHAKLRSAAASRAILVIGPKLLRLMEET